MQGVSFPSFGSVSPIAGPTPVTRFPVSLLGNTSGATGPGATTSASAAPARAIPNIAHTPTTEATPAPAAHATGAARSGTAPAAAAAPARAASSGGGTAAVANSSDAEEIVTGYSTKVGSTHYSARVAQSNGEYTASIPNLEGATATGSTEQAAETYLSLRIDALV